MAQLSFMRVAATMADLGRITLGLENTSFCPNIAPFRQKTKHVGVQ